MKYERLASLALVALSTSTSVSAAPLKADGNGSCPAGYSPSVYYVTVTAEPSSTSIVEPSSSSPTPISIEVTSSITTTAIVEAVSTSSSASSSASGLVETIPTAVVEAATSTASTTATAEYSSASSLSITETAPTQVAVVQPSTTTTEEEKSSTTTAAEKVSSISTAASSSSTSTSSGTTSGEATFYGGNVSGGTCSFADYTIPSHLSGTAFSGEAWNDAAECGACVAVTGPNGDTVKVMIVDKCPECAPTHLDLFESAFTDLASASEGQIPISYSFTSCAITTPLTLRNKSGTSAYWFSMQVVNANGAVKSLEVSTDGGSTWQSTTRSDYNYFENSSGFGTDSVDVRVTGADGGVITVKNVSVASGESVTADGNF
ncbi:RlpA-like double-psi beta-barrel-protein domain-containing protein-containing protein [Aspergillus multicolor]|uniref:putative extracellular cellulase CelA/allergen Asp F7-like n=1 Tax=Aspergillus multicolor TaxID=41759 RepID=UPI003CCCF029